MAGNKKKYMDMFLMDVYKQYIAIKDEEYKKQQNVFMEVFKQMKEKMKKQCQYFNKYSTQVMYAGSVNDGIKVSKLDEFDMDIVIRLPINYDAGDDGIHIENDEPGFVKLIIKNEFDVLDKKPNWEKCHVVTRDWRDADKYLLQNKFRHWLHSIVQKAVNDFNGTVVVNDVKYKLTYQEAGPAFTLKIRNVNGNEPFLLDVDLVPVIRFMIPRWPDNYRSYEGNQAKEWYVVPKPNKTLQDEGLKSRCWRLSFQDFEKDIMRDCEQLKPTIRLVKKLRDSLEMKCIASYYIKTLFLWKAQEVKDKTYWRKGISVHFREMVELLYEAIKKKNIPYFWQKENNLIAGMRPTIADLYANKLKQVIKDFDDNNVEKVVASLLSTNEMADFKKTDFYFTYSANLRTAVETVTVSRQTSTKPASVVTPEEMKKYIDDKIKPMQDRVDALTDEVNFLRKKVNNIDSDKDYKAKFYEVGEALGAALDPLHLDDDRPKRLKTNSSKSLLDDSDIEILPWETKHSLDKSGF